MSWLVLLIVLLWTLGCIYVFKLEFSPGICQRVGLLDYIFSFLRKLYIAFHRCTNLHWRNFLNIPNLRSNFFIKYLKIGSNHKLSLCLLFRALNYLLLPATVPTLWRDLPHFLCVFCAMLCLVIQSFPILCNPMDDSLPGSSVHGDSPGKNPGVGCHALLHVCLLLNIYF